MSDIDNKLYDEFIEEAKIALNNNTPIDGEYCNRAGSWPRYGTYLSVRMTLGKFHYSTEGFGDILLCKGIHLRRPGFFKWCKVRSYIKELAYQAECQKNHKKEMERIRKLLS